jgi:hypothetical protein
MFITQNSNQDARLFFSADDGNILGTQANGERDCVLFDEDPVV